MGVCISVLHKVYPTKNEYSFYLMNYDEFKDHSKWDKGLYNCEEREEIVSMSYMGFNNFRDWLAQKVGYSPAVGRKFDWIENIDPNKPLFKLFNFADNEGHWDYDTSQEILATFKKGGR